MINITNYQEDLLACTLNSLNLRSLNNDWTNFFNYMYFVIYIYIYMWYVSFPCLYVHTYSKYNNALIQLKETLKKAPRRPREYKLPIVTPLFPTTKTLVLSMFVSIARSQAEMGYTCCGTINLLLLFSSIVLPYSSTFSL